MTTGRRAKRLGVAIAAIISVIFFSSILMSVFELLNETEGALATVEIGGFVLECPESMQEGTTNNCSLTNTSDSAAEWPSVAVVHLSSDSNRALVLGSPIDLQWGTLSPAQDIEADVAWIGDVLVAHSYFDWPGEAAADDNSDGGDDTRTVPITIVDDDDYEEEEVFYISLAASGTRGTGRFFQNIQAIKIPNSDEKSSDAVLRSLSVSFGNSTTTLFDSPTSGEGASYTVEVDYSVTGISIEAITNHERASGISLSEEGESEQLEALRSGQRSREIMMDVGTKRLSVEVVAEDAVSSETYSIGITRGTAPGTVTLASGNFALECPASMVETSTATCLLSNPVPTDDRWPVIAIIHSANDGDSRALVAGDPLIPTTNSDFQQDVSFSTDQELRISNSNFGYGELLSGGSITERTVYGYEKFQWKGRRREGKTVWKVQLDLIADELDESAETFYVALAPNGYTGLTELVRNKAPVVLLQQSDCCSDDPTEVGLSTDVPTVAEGRRAATVTVTAELNRATRVFPTSVWVSVTGGTASAGSDYKALEGFRVTIPAGEASGTGSFELAPVGDRVDEPDETVVLEAVTASGLDVGYPAGQSALTVTILDDDERSIRAEPAALALQEGISRVFSVWLGSEPTGEVVMEIIADGGSVRVSRPRLLFDADHWRVPQSMVVTARDDSDASAESATITLKVSGADYSGLPDMVVPVDVTDDDRRSTEVRLSTDVPTVAEGEGAATVTVTAELNRATRDVPTPVRVSVAGGTASAGSDYEALEGFVVTVPAGEASGEGSFVLAPVDDDIDEPDETVVLGATTESGLAVVYPAGQSALAVTIVDNDGAAMPRLQTSTVTATEIAMDLDVPGATQAVLVHLRFKASTDAEWTVLSPILVPAGSSIPVHLSDLRSDEVHVLEASLAEDFAPSTVISIRTLSGGGPPGPGDDDDNGDNDGPPGPDNNDDNDGPPGPDNNDDNDGPPGPDDDNDDNDGPPGPDDDNGDNDGPPGPDDDNGDNDGPPGPDDDNGDNDGPPGPGGDERQGGAGEVFLDLGDGGVHEAPLRALASVGVFDGTGCGDGRLCPGGAVLRWEMAVWLVRVVDGADPEAVGSSRFEDVDGGVWWAAHVERLADLGITVGCSRQPARFCPHEAVSRAQMASFLVRAFDLEPAPSAGFVDTGTSSHRANIDALFAAGVTRGCVAEPLTYCGARPTTRAQMASFLHRAAAGAGVFLDLAGTGVHEAPLRALASVGVFDGTGCGDGRLCPGGAVLRWEMAVWLVRVLEGADPGAVGSSRFEDVDGGVWWAAHVERLADLGITVGCSRQPARFCPHEAVSRAQMASFLVRAFDLEPAPPAGFVDTETSSHRANIDALFAAGVTRGCATEPLTYCGARPTTRAQMASFLHRAALSGS